jgi:hypothetical protein
MRLLIAIPVMDQYELGRCSLATWDWMTSAATDFLLIDNGSRCDWFKWLETAHLKAKPRWRYLRNEHNIGVVRSAQQAYDYALEHKFDLLALTHNDVWVFEQDWDHRLLGLLFGFPDIGGVGFFGSKGCNRDGLRLQTFGNVLDFGHGRRMIQPWEPAVIFDGFFQCYSMDMLKSLKHKCIECDGRLWRDWNCASCHGKGHQSGFDQRYDMMHIYDYDYSLASIAAGWKNAVLNVPCHHLSGLTANNAAAATSGQDKMYANIKRFHEKWDGRLGVSVNDTNWTYTWEQR